MIRTTAVRFALVLATFLSANASAVSNTVTLHDTSGALQGSRVVTISRVFRQSEIPQFVRAVVAGSPVLTQCDVKNRWPDGSLKHAIVSFMITNLAAGSSVVVAFTNQPSGNNGDELDVAGMLAANFNFEVKLHLTGAVTRTISARDMLAAGNIRYWLKGPLVTAVILEDRSAARAHDVDFGDGRKTLHPIIEAWFYPSDGRVSVGAALENCWAASASSNAMNDVSYSAAISAGSTNTALVLAQPFFNHIGRSRWHRRFWINGAPPSLRFDHNLPYLKTTMAIPNYDTSITLSNALLASYSNAWNAADKSLPGSGLYSKALTAAGQHDWVGLMNTWDTIYLMSMNEHLLECSLGNADQAGRVPVHFREADTMAGSGDFFDAPFTGSVATVGRVVSINARRTMHFDDLPWYEIQPADRIWHADITKDGWAVSTSHMPDAAYLPYLISGRHHYLEELHFWASYALGANNGAYGGTFARQGDAGYFNGQVRGDAWALRTCLYAAFITPDGWPEKDYFTDKVLNNLAKWEGEHQLPISDPSRQKHWGWGASNRVHASGPSPLGFWQDRGAGLVQPPLKLDGSLFGGGSPWEDHFLLCSLGMARQFGFPAFPLVGFMGRRVIHQLLNPASNPYLVEAYRYPTIAASNASWISSWPDVTSFYADVPTNWTMSAEADNGYGFIALGALSFLYDVEADGFSGADAWDFYYAQKPLKHLFATTSPKFAILPRTVEASSTNAFTAHPLLVGLPDNTAINLGSYTCTNPVGGSNCGTITDYSRLIYDPQRHQFLMFGGGHAATFRTDVDVFSTSNLTWRSAYTSTPCSVMSDSNQVDRTNGAWLATGHPIARHTYDELAMDPASGDLLLLSGAIGAGECSVPNDPFYIPSRVAHYDPDSTAWMFSPVSATSWSSLSSAEPDPVSGQVALVSEYGLWLYDPAGMSAQQVFPQFAAQVANRMGYAKNLVYFPPTDRMYYINNSNGNVFELTLNRMNFFQSTFMELANLTGPLPATPETGWAYDPVNRVIGGGVHNGAFHTFDPVRRVWSKHAMNVSANGQPGPIGTQAYHALDYDPVNNIYLFITDYASGRKVWAYRFKSERSVSLRRGTNGQDLVIRGVPGRTYRVEQSEDLSEWTTATNVVVEAAESVIGGLEMQSTPTFFRTVESE